MDTEERENYINELFEEKSYFARLRAMFSGLRMPSSSGEYKLARTELQRLTAPLVAILLPVVGVAVLIVITAVQSEHREVLQIDVGRIEEKAEELEDEPEPEPEEIDMTQDVDVNVDVSVDAAPQMVSPAPPSPNPGGEPDKVAAPPSPVTMNAVAGSLKMRGLGDGDGGGFGTLIGGKGGKAMNIEGCLIGIIIDFKYDANKNPREGYKKIKENWWKCPNYYKDVRYLVENNFSAGALANYFVPDRRVALTHICIPEQTALNGPKAFGVDDVMESSSFIAYYSGKITPEKSGRFRFCACFNNVLIVRINQRVVMDHELEVPTAGPMPGTGWTSSNASECGKWPGLYSHEPITVGDWIDFEAGKEYFCEIIVGERPGDRVGGYLLIQEDGVDYPQTRKGYPKLPVFASRPLSSKEKERIREQKAFPIAGESPRFNSRISKKLLKEAIKNDIRVEVDI